MIYLNLMELLNLYNISIGLIIYLNLCIHKVIYFQKGGGGGGDISWQTSTTWI